MNKRAFTLIELLIVIAIIGVLAALSAPAFAKVRELARTAFCANNLRQIGIATYIYIDDHDFKFPPRQAFQDDNLISWFSEIDFYLTDRNVWNCPDYKYSMFGSGTMSYGINAFGLGTFIDFDTLWKGKDISEIKNSSQAIEIADSSYSGINSGIDIICNTTYPDCPPSNRHSGGANVLFVDGHVSWHLRSFLLEQGKDWWNY